MDKRHLTCCFTGHRTIRPGELNHVNAALERHILTLHDERGVRYFGAGGALGFDTLAAEAVLQLRGSIRPDLRLILVLPCGDQSDRWPLADQAKYERIKLCADKVVTLERHYRTGIMHARNRHLVDHAGFCICYHYKNEGGTAYTVDYARRQGLEIFNCAEER